MRMNVSALMLSMAMLASLVTALPVSAEKPLNARIVYGSSDVPDEMFGYWDRHRTLIDSTRTDSFPPQESGSWMLSRQDERIYLMNPDTGAMVEVSVTDIRNNTAVFEYKKQLANGNWCREELELTLDNPDVIRGFQRKSCYQPRTSGSTPYFYASARVKGVRSDNLPPLKF